jgi:hypothetical protein
MALILISEYTIFSRLQLLMHISNVFQLCAFWLKIASVLTIIYWYYNDYYTIDMPAVLATMVAQNSSSDTRRRHTSNAPPSESTESTESSNNNNNSLILMCNWQIDGRTRFSDVIQGIPGKNIYKKQHRIIVNVQLFRDIAVVCQ